MKNKILLGLLMILTVTAACNQKKEEPVAAVIDKEQIKSEIQAIENAFAEVYNTGNVDDSSYYADDATSFFNGKMPLVGKEAIHQSMKEEVANFTKGDKIAFETKEIYAADNGEHVLEIGSYKISDAAGTQLRSGNYFSLFKKVNGKYQCFRDISNSESAGK